MSFDLPPTIYNALQKLVHGNYESIGARIAAMKNAHAGRALELGCGTGTLSRFFQPGTYTGVDMDSQRIDLAKRLHPGHEFHVGDATVVDPSWVADFAFVFCHAFLHHIDDGHVDRIMTACDRASRLVATPVYMLILEPVLPERTFSNIPGYLLGKLDRGHHVRKLSRLKVLLGDRVSEFQTCGGPWYWPVPGAACMLEFLTTESQKRPLGRAA